MKRVLITGASGFIGKNLVRGLLNEGWDVIAALRDKSSERALIEFVGKPAISKIRIVLTGSIDGGTSWKEPLKEAAAVIHAAARVHHPQEIQSEFKNEYFKVNCDATENLARQAGDAGIQHFVFLSSVLTVCSRSEEALNETTACAPDTVYGQSKLAAEKALIAAAKESGMAQTILRLPLVYGPGNLANMDRLIRLVRSGMPLPVKAIRNRRSFLYIGNLNHAILRCLSDPAARNQKFFLRNGQDYSTPSLMAEIASCLGKRSLQFAMPVSALKLAGRAGDSVQRFFRRSCPLSSINVDRLLSSLFVDDRLFRSKLRWTPPYSAHEGFVHTISRGGYQCAPN